MRAFDVWGMKEPKRFPSNIRKEALNQMQSNAVSPLGCFKAGQRFIKARGPWERLNVCACPLRCLTKGSTFPAHILIPSHGFPVSEARDHFPWSGRLSEV